MSSKINSENSKKMKIILKKKVDDMRAKLSKEYEGSIHSQIAVNRSEINDIGIIIFAFNSNDSPIKFVRTEPLFFFKEKNFDILLYGNKNIILISVKEGVSAHNAISIMNGLKEYSKEVVENIEITNTIEGRRMRILDFYKSLVGDIIDKEFVLATQKPCVTEITSKAKEIKYNLFLWALKEKDDKIFITPEIIKGDDDTFFGHKDKDLRAYLKELKERGRSYNNPLNFLISSSKYLKSIEMSIPLSMKKDFNYEEWNDLFNIDLMNWHLVEKETVYKNYINYGLNCKFIKCNEDRGNILQNKYSIISMYSKAPMIEKDIINKMIRVEMGEKIKIAIPQLKNNALSEVLSKKAEERGETLKKFLTATDNK
ncbi:DUF1024 family protein [Candidatus Pacearchaeota archaeon]|nr:DUF1024 family protein [Candidatus Pacearchaeota archaeon]